MAPHLYALIEEAQGTNVWGPDQEFRFFEQMCTE
jgi:hypothetical protein